VIEQGKAEGWTTLEEFERAISAALSPEPEPEVECDFGGAWVALITGFNDHYTYQREFVRPAKTEGRFKYFWYPEEGIVETCYKSAKGNDTRHFRLIEGGKEIRILTEAEVDEILGDGAKDAPEASKPGVDRTFETTQSMGVVGQTVKVGEEYFVIVSTSTITTYHDEDGIAHKRYPSGVVVSYEEYEVTTRARFATLEEIQVTQREAEVNLAARKATRRLEEIFEEGDWTKPESPAPSGVKVACSNTELSYDSTYFQVDRAAGLLWRLVYNGRDGDLWAINNLTSQIARCCKLTPELEKEMEVLITAIAARHPEAVSW
jgi:hypothetical protein